MSAPLPNRRRPGRPSGRNGATAAATATSATPTTATVTPVTTTATPVIITAATHTTATPAITMAAALPVAAGPILTAAQRSARAIRGPQSALTDFLASHNINANQIRQDANARRAAALASRQAANEEEDEDGDDPLSAGDVAPVRKNESKAQMAKRKKEEEKAIAKIKASKQFQRHRKQYGSGDDATDEDEAARAIFEADHAPMPGQMENCEICGKRFSVTTYSRAGPDGGLLCPKCSKEIDKEQGHARKKRKVAAGRARRNAQSQLLDGIYPGAKSLVTLCVETVAKNVDMADSLGDLPAPLIDKLAAILAKRRLMSPITLDLFLQPGMDTVTVYDGAKLGPDDYTRIFQIVPTVKHLRLRNAVQFKDKVVDHLLGTTVELESLSLHGANLIGDEMWNRYFTAKGSHLRSFKVYYTDGYFGDEQIEIMTTTCPDLERLKITHNQKVTDKGIVHIANFKKLKYLSLEFYETATIHTSSEPYVEILNGVGSELRTFSLETAHLVNDTILEAIHDNCRHLNKLRISDNEVMTDEGFAKLFTDWQNTGLSFIDFHKCRHIDAAEPGENPDGVGLCSSGFEALMKHSGRTLHRLNIHSCRHISLESFEKIFGGDTRYPELTEIDVSFCQAVNDFIVGCIFRSCPKLMRLKVFGNFGVRDVRIPKGKILIGVPTAMGMQIEGMEDVDGEGRFI